MSEERYKELYESTLAQLHRVQKRCEASEKEADALRRVVAAQLVAAMEDGILDHQLGILKSERTRAQRFLAALEKTALDLPSRWAYVVKGAAEVVSDELDDFLAWTNALESLDLETLERLVGRREQEEKAREVQRVQNRFNEERSLKWARVATGLVYSPPRDRGDEKAIMEALRSADLEELCRLYGITENGGI